MTIAFGELVREHRIRYGWKQEKLAEQWGYTREYVSQVERGKRQLYDPRQMRRLAEILSISEEELAQVGIVLPPLKTQDVATLSRLISVLREMRSLSKPD